MIKFKVPTGLVDEMIDPDMTTESLAGLNAWLAAALAQEPGSAVTDSDITLRGPVTRDFAYTWGKPDMSREEAQAILPIKGGYPNPLFRVIDSIDKQKETDPNIKPIFSVGETWSDMAEVGPVIRKIWLASGYLYCLVMSGGECIDAPIWFVVPEANYEDNLPEGLPNRTKKVLITEDSGEVDEQGDPIMVPVLDEAGEPTYNTVAKKWSEWNEVAHSGPWGGNYYISSSAGTRYLLNASTCVVAANSVGISIIGLPEFKKLQSDNTPEGI